MLVCRLFIEDDRDRLSGNTGRYQISDTGFEVIDFARRDGPGISREPGSGRLALAERDEFEPSDDLVNVVRYASELRCRATSLRTASHSLSRTVFSAGMRFADNCALEGVEFELSGDLVNGH